MSYPGKDAGAFHGLSLDLTSLRRAYATEGLTPAILVQLVLDRVAAYGDPALFLALATPDMLAARAAMLAAMAPAARGPLWGVPVAVKDNIDVAGLPTTAACPQYSHVPDQSATLVQRLEAAGAIIIGKTNLDQFATGLVGVRSPYGVPRNPFDAEYMPGGSSSGSAVAVSAGIVSVAIGTDTAGSGRVPAGCNNLVGLKPSKGLFSCAGVVPACRSLDCPSVFALTVADALDAARVIEAVDPLDAFTRAAPGGSAFRAGKGDLAGRRFGVPQPDQLRFFGDDAMAALYDSALMRLRNLGAELVEIDFAPFTETANLLYSGPWVAERRAAIQDFMDTHPGALHPVTEHITLGADRYSAVDTFRALYRLEDLRRATAPIWGTIDAMVLPTAGSVYKVAEIEADPITLNSNLGAYTNFVNLLDLSAIAVPAGFLPNGMPAGITLVGPAFADGQIAAWADSFHRATGLGLGRAGSAHPGAMATGDATFPQPFLPLAVVGAHLTGQPLNHQLIDIGAQLLQSGQTAPAYRLYALKGAGVARPGLIRVAEGGVAIAVEVWAVPADRLGGFIAAIPAPLGIGKVELAEGSVVSGFLCEALALTDAEDISAFGGWKAWRAQTS